MNSIRYHLLKEDRADYERLLDEALRAVFRTQPAGAGRPLSLEALRSMALNAEPVITSAAEPEYVHYVLVRGGHESTARRALSATRRPAEEPAGPGRRLRAAVLGTGRPGDTRVHAGVPPKRWASMSFGRRLVAALIGLRVRPEAPAARAGAARSPTPATGRRVSSGGSALAVFCVRASLLFGVGAVVLLLIGFALGVISRQSEFVGRLLVTGWAFGALSVVAIVIALCRLVTRALRVGGAASAGGADGDVARAREAWRRALLERGIQPFLREAMGDLYGRPADFAPVRQLARNDRTPRTGYFRPNFTSPDFPAPDGLPAAGSRPAPTGPDADPPDTGGPEPRP